LSLVSERYAVGPAQKGSAKFFTSSRFSAQTPVELSSPIEIYLAAVPVVTLTGQRYGLTVNFFYFPPAGAAPFTLNLVDLSAPLAATSTLVNATTPWLGGSRTQATSINPDGSTKTSRFNQAEPVMVSDREGR
jgi:hypothetical protein